jgi:hypothetical protein
MIVMTVETRASLNSMQSTTTAQRWQHTTAPSAAAVLLKSSSVLK